MLASFKAENRRRGVQILRAKSPLGPFVPISDGPITPPEWESLDGTLYLDGQGRPWLIFCHEWTQLGDGAICGMRLEKDLSAAAEAPVTLFHASQSGWSVADTGQIVRKTGENYVTDGPFLHRCEDGTLWMLWSSYARCGYAVGLAKSLSSDIPGPWQHLTKPLFERNGGHGMLFRTLKGQLRLAIHRPNDTPWERPCFLPRSTSAVSLKIPFSQRSSISTRLTASGRIFLMTSVKICFCRRASCMLKKLLRIGTTPIFTFSANICVTSTVCLFPHQDMPTHPRGDLSMACFGFYAQEHRGGIYRRSTGNGVPCISGSADGVTRGSGKNCWKFWLMSPILNG